MWTEVRTMKGTLKICLDAGHFGKQNNNPKISPVYWESLMAWDLHLMLKEELEKYKGVTVITTRADETKDMGLEARGKKAKGCDLFISLHSNACDTETVDRPVVIYPVSGKCKGLAECLAGAVRMVMQTNDQWRTYQRWNSAHNADYYGVIRGASSVGVPGLIIEHSFHTNTRAAKWLQSAANLRKLAEAEAEVLAVEYGLSRKGCPFTDVKEGKWYYDDVLWAYENGITSGVSKDKFGVGQPCTREQVVAFLHNYDKYLENK
jgi:N-acetylmuramoyl-L-alanine amidase